MHHSSDDTSRLTRAGGRPCPSPYPPLPLGFGGKGRVRGLLLTAVVVCSFLGGCAALTNPVADGVTVRHLPRELLAPSKVDELTIPLTMLGQPPPATYQ